MGETKRCNDSLQATEGIQLDQQRRQWGRYMGPHAGFRAANVEESLPEKSCDSIWATDYPAAVKAQRPRGNICKGIKVITTLQTEPK